jgi:tetratricopeptide (TPR) repeat protein/TolB-like protein
VAEALETRVGVTGTLGHYNLGEKIGAGAMGEVFLARDQHLDHEVAIKILPPGLITDPSARRHFRNEAQALCKLNHPNIACFYDFDTQGTTDFLVMEFVPGVTISEKISSGPLVEQEAVELAIQLATGLSAAHQEGVIHRDLKPKNLKLTPTGRLKILDFGLARLLPGGPPESADTESRSRSWVVVGTLPYMAPEQLRGQMADARSDIWATGVVLYEMLTGHLPFGEGSSYTIADAIQHRPAPAPSAVVPSISPRTEKVILKCLEKDPRNRYQSASELLSDLQDTRKQTTAAERVTRRLRFLLWPRGGPRISRILLLTLLVAGAILFLSPPTGVENGMHAFPRKQIAVLPFDAVPSDTGTQAFSRGLSESLTAKLTRLTEKHNLQVVPESEIRGQSVSNVDQARALLGANLVFEGTYHISGSRTRVTYSLINATTRALLRGDTITADVDDPFALEDRVVSSALTSLEVELSTQERQELSDHGTGEPAAYDLYLRGRGYLQDYEKPENISSAIDLFLRALDRDPNYALASAGLGQSYWMRFESTHESRWIEKAEEACRRANLAGAGHGCLGTIYNGTGKYADAVGEFQQELASDPTSDSAYRGLAYAYEHAGKVSDAERTYRRAIEVRPQYWAGYNWLGTFLYRYGRYPEAAQAFAKVTEISPDNMRGYYNLGGVDIAMGNYDAAVPVLQQSILIRPTQDAYNNLGTAYFYLHRFEEAADAFGNAVKLDPRDRISWGNLADANYWISGRRDESRAAYRKAISLAEEELRVNPTQGIVLSYLALYHSMIGNKTLALSALSKAIDLAPHDANVLFNAALIHKQFGDRSNVLTFLQKALKAGLSPELIQRQPNFDDLKSDRRFQQLLRNKTAAQNP